MTHEQPRAADEAAKTVHGDPLTDAADGAGAAAGNVAEGAVAGESAHEAPDDRSDHAAAASHDDGGKGRPPKLQELVDEPAKVMRIGTMIRQLLEEVRNAPLDDRARERLVEIHERSLKELQDGLAPQLVDELHRISLPFSDDVVPSDAELRIAQAQLVGWLEGLFHGIQTALAAQQMANQQMEQRMQMRQLPPGTMIAPGVVIGDNGEPTHAQPTKSGDDETRHGPGQYL